MAGNIGAVYGMALAFHRIQLHLVVEAVDGIFGSQLWRKMPMETGLSLLW
jgi:hypothetical protein